MTKEQEPSPTRQKWQREAKAVKAIQMAFDVNEEIQYQVRREALDGGVSPSDKIREILGLPQASRRIRPRLTISLSEKDLLILAERFQISVDDKLRIKQKAAELLAAYSNQSIKANKNEV